MRIVNFPNYAELFNNPAIPRQTERPPINVLGGVYLLTEAELADDLTVSIYVFTIKVVKETSALTNHFQQATSAAVVVFVLAQVSR
jgi:hypothetical protein